ncbi:MAG TPA: DCC1-like thiol-disulfide oxidoreductase family protein [Allocoleopsis sp.]
MPYTVIYDGKCNLCVTLVQLLESLDKGDRFQYIPMQDPENPQRWNVTPQDCELGMILIDAAAPERRWQGSDAAEEIGQLLPLGNLFVAAYRALPGLKWSGDRIYEQVRDNRYTLFGQRTHVYHSAYPACDSNACDRYFTTPANSEP